MSSRQNWFWVTLAVLLGALVFLQYEYRHKKPAGPTRVIPGMAASRVTSVQVRPLTQPEIRAEKTNGGWVLTDPVAYPAQSANIDRLLAALEHLTAAVHISAAELQNRPDAEEEYGLSNPQATIIVQGDFRERIVIGTNTPPGDQVFLKVGRDSGVYIVDSDLLRFVPRNATEWRDPALLDIASFAPEHITITNVARVWDLERVGANKTWRLLFPGFAVRADNARVEEMVQGLRNIRIQQFVTDDPRADLESFGLQNPDLQLAFRSGSNLIALLQFGKAATNNAHELYARRPGQTGVVTVSADVLSPWRSPEKFRDPFLLSLSAPVSSIEVHGQDSFILQQTTNQGWRVGPQDFPADVPLVKDLLSSLSGLQIAAFVRDLVPKPDLATYGLTNPPALEFILRGPTTNPPAAATNGAPTNALLADIQFGSVQGDNVFVQRADENHVYAVKFSDFRKLGSASWEFHERRIWSLKEDDIAHVTIHQSGRTRTIIRKAQYDWALAPNSQGLIEPLPIDQTVSGLCNLSATAWVARGEQNRSPYGFANDDYTITIELKNGEKHTIELGRKGPADFPYGGVRLDGDFWIFEFPLRLCRDILLYLRIPANIP
jgi:hypothetical protein